MYYKYTFFIKYTRKTNYLFQFRFPNKLSFHDVLFTAYHRTPVSLKNNIYSVPFLKLLE